MRANGRVKDYIVYPGIIIALVWIGAISFSYIQRQNSITSAKITLSTVAQGLAEQINILSTNVDRILLFLRQLDKNNQTSDTLAALTVSNRAGDNLVLQVALMDEHGIVMESSLGRPKELVDLKDRPHFRVHKESIKDFLYISDPVVGRVSNKASIQFSRRIVEPNGQFGGVIVGSVSPDRLSNYYSSGFFDGHATITLFNERGIILARSRNNPGEKDISDISAAPNYIAFKEKGNTCSVSNSYFDETDKLICFHRVSDFPLGIAISIPFSNIVSSDGSERITLFAVASIVSFLAFGAMFISRQRELLLETASKELVQTKEIVQARAFELEITLQSIDQGILIFDRTGGLLFENPIALEIKKYGPEIDHAIELRLSQFRKIEPVTNQILTCDDSNIEEHTVESTIIPRTVQVKGFHAENGYYVVSLTDISTLKDAEKVLKRSIDKEKLNAQRMRTFLGVMSHEFRTPLHSILGFSNLLKKTVISSDEKELIGFTLDAAMHLKSLLGDISDFIYFDVGEITLKEVHFKLTSFRKKIERISETLSSGRALTFFTDFDENLPNTVFGDERRLTQLMTNFLSNAIKYTDKGSITTSYRLLSRDSSTVVIEICVSDTGPGISRKELAKVFEPFFRGERENKVADGTGLGLTISKQIVSLMSGQISIASEVGEGTAITARIPFKLVNPTSERPPVETHFALPRLSILVAEDSPANRLLIEKLLSSLEQDVVAVNDGVAAVEEARRRVFDAIILDIQMPRLDGYGAAREITQIYRELGKSSTIAALTAQVIDFDWTLASGAGFDTLLEKPLQDRDLIEFITAAKANRDPS